jgi:hypothetical protein
VVILLSLPFVVWVSVPGMSTLCGPAILVLAGRLAVGKPARLPRTLGIVRCHHGSNARC